MGYVVPKRNAPRAVTRVAVKRQMRAAIARHGMRLPSGQWVLRLRAPMGPPARFRSATSVELTEAVRAELEGLLVALQRTGR